MTFNSVEVGVLTGIQPRSCCTVIISATAAGHLLGRSGAEATWGETDDDRVDIRHEANSTGAGVLEHRKERGWGLLADEVTVNAGGIGPRAVANPWAKRQDGEEQGGEECGVDGETLIRVCSVSGTSRGSK